MLNNITKQQNSTPTKTKTNFHRLMINCEWLSKKKNLLMWGWLFWLMEKQHAMLWKCSLCWFVDSPHGLHFREDSFAFSTFFGRVHHSIFTETSSVQVNIEDKFFFEKIYSLFADEWFLPMSAKLRMIGRRLIFDSLGFFCSFSC